MSPYSSNTYNKICFSFRQNCRSATIFWLLLKFWIWWYLVSPIFFTAFSLTWKSVKVPSLDTVAMKLSCKLTLLGLDYFGLFKFQIGRKSVIDLVEIPQNYLTVGANWNENTVIENIKKYHALFVNREELFLVVDYISEKNFRFVLTLQAQNKHLVL